MTCEELWGEQGLRGFLQRFGIRPDEKSGQHFLHDPSVLHRITNAGGSSDGAVEIGSGVGNLTCLLANRHEDLWAIEIDERFQAPFQENLSGQPHVEFICRNYLELNIAELALPERRETTLYGNIPYHLTSPILRKAMNEHRFFDQAILTLQREVARKVLAEPGTREVTPLTFLTYCYADSSLVTEIEPESFYPAPEVASSAVKFSFLETPRISTDRDLFFKVVRAVFKYRRKTIRNALKEAPELNLSPKRVDSILSTSDVSRNARPEQLDFTDFRSLTLSFRRLVE
ncbi:MAG: 16S rRNA (adenine(1518)-N(6)/adenine(1519)-N(6))-dimethyltransferase RsmA [Candidatus Acetothermia bacterium]